MALSTNQRVVRELVFEFLEREGEEATEVLEELCTRAPEHASALRARVEILASSGLLLGAASDPPRVPERLATFRILERLGGGGMGVVYRARDEGLGRDVALKVIRPAELLFEGARERFRREVESVARLAHPGIVPVYTAGEEDDVPFLAMECIEGCTLAEALRVVRSTETPVEELRGADLARAIAVVTEPKSTASRAPEAAPFPDAALFSGTWVDACTRIVRNVASALEHAHTNGVLHRDVKPSNVMITGSGRVMLIDFGLASAEGTPRITKTGSAMGSLAYMSPEQLDGEWEKLDARGDVYALGVTLYELLTLDLPFREPSITGLRSAVAAGSFPAVRRRNRRASWELETIVACAMDPDPDHRYGSAAAIAHDLTATLDGRAISARRASLLRRAQRWTTRHPAAAALGAVLVTGVVGGPALFAWREREARLAIEAKSRVIEAQSVELSQSNAELASALEELRLAVLDAEDQRDEARRQGARAERNFDRAVGAVDAMLTQVGDVELRDVPHLHELRRSVLEDALAFYRELLAEESDDDELRLETARAWRRVGEVESMLDRSEEADRSLVRALDLFDDCLEGAADPATLLGERADAHRLRAFPLRQLGRPGEARRSLEAAVADLARGHALAPERDDLEMERLALAVDLAILKQEQGEGRAARAELTARLPELESALERSPNERRAAYALARVHHALGVIAAESAAPTESARLEHGRTAEEHHRRAIELLEPLHRADPGDTQLRAQLARSCTNRGSVLAGRGELDEAERFLTRGSELSTTLCHEFPGVATYVDDLATAWVMLGFVRARGGDVDAGLDLIRRAEQAWEELLRENPAHGAMLQQLASAQIQSAAIAWQFGRDAERTLAAIERAVPTTRRALQASPSAPKLVVGLAWCHRLRAEALLERGDVEASVDAAFEWAAASLDTGGRLDAAAHLSTCAARAIDAGLDATASRSEERVFELMDRAFEDGATIEDLESNPDWAALLER